MPGAHRVAFALGFALLVGQIGSAIADGRTEESVAHVWTDALLFAIGHDYARPPVHARNIYHLAATMYDAWATFEPQARPLFLGSGMHPACNVDGLEPERLRKSSRAARERAIAQGAWHLLRHRYRDAADAPAVRAHLDRLAEGWELQEHPAEDDPAARLGHRVAACVIGVGRRDDSNEDAAYANIAYAPINAPLDPTRGGNAALSFPSRWQPLRIPGFRDQAGRPAEPAEFLGADWGEVTPFALEPADATRIVRGGVSRTVYFDPGAPPMLEIDPDAYARQFALVAAWSSHLDPDDTRLIDISARARSGAIGADDLDADSLAHFALSGGQTTRIVVADGAGTASPVRVPLGDYARVIAEYWADGVDSETPPGHWLRLYNEHVSTHPERARRLGGDGARLDALGFDIVAYLALGGALHDAAIAAWSVKSAYDYVRPMSAIRYLDRPRTTTGPGGASPVGLPIVPGHIERVRIGDPLAGPGGIDVGRTKIRAWRGPTAIHDPDTDVAGVGWILARDWWPYQRPNFVTPPFAGYVSGHSTFSRAAAVVLERLTGSPFWPGGSAGFTAKANEFLVFERGPSVDVPLRWATYRDAADETGLSRVWGGIHPPVDDLRGRRIGARVGERAWRRTASLIGPVGGRSPGAVQGCSAGGAPVWLFGVGAWMIVRRRDAFRFGAIARR